MNHQSTARRGRSKAIQPRGSGGLRKHAFGLLRVWPMICCMLLSGISHYCNSAPAAEHDEGADVLSTAERDAFFTRYFQRMTTPRSLFTFADRESWLRHAQVLRQHVLQSIGLWPLPERVPLDPRITGRIERQDAVIERVYYQTLPGIYASGYLYRPRGPSAGALTKPLRRPAVLNPHGHWPEGAADTNVQARCIGLARMGLVAFCPDSTHVMDLPIGLCPIGLMTWNNIRALDFLQSLEDVDPDRLGCTGGSGGGQQTLYLAALDSRVKAIVPAVLVSWFWRILFVSGQTHCFCNHAPSIARITDEPELAGLFAPRPALFICATGDWTRDFPNEEFPEIKHIYRLVGGEVSCIQFDKPHNYDRDSREQMYAWMNKHLLDARSQQTVREGDIQLESPAALKKQGSLPPGLAGLDGAPDYFRSKHSFNRTLPGGAGQPAHSDMPTTQILRDLLGERGPCVPLDAKSRGTSSAAGFRVEKVLIETEPDVRIPVWVLEPERSTVDRRRPAIVLAHPDGKRALLENRGALVRGLLDAGVVVVAPDMRLRGELRRRWDWNCVIWGRPEIGMAAHDLAATATYLRSRAGVDAKRVRVVGLGETAAMALFAAALDDRVAGVAVERGGPLFAETRGPQAPAGILRHGDLPEFAGLVAPRPMWINGEGGRFRFTQHCYGRLHSSRAFRRSDLDQAEFDKELIRWAGRGWR